MDTTAPAIRALTVETDRLRTANAELLDALRYVGAVLSDDPKTLKNDMLWSAHSRAIATIAKHGA
jgi:hypothetical protein